MIITETHFSLSVHEAFPRLAGLTIHHQETRTPLRPREEESVATQITTGAQIQL